MMKKLAVASAFVLSAALVYNLAMREESSVALPAGERAPALALAAPGGKTISLAGFSGKVVLVDFWATWCPPCREEIPDLAALDRELGPKGFAILGVSMDDDGAAAVRAFTARRPIPYPVVLNGGGPPPSGWLVPALPTAYLIGRDGTMLRRWVGGKDPDELRAAVEAALAAPSAAPGIAKTKREGKGL